MAGIQADTQVISKVRSRPLHAVDDRRELLKAAADLGALARHGLEQHRRVQRGNHRLAKRFDDELDAAFRTLPHVRTRMKIVVVPWQGLHAFEVLRHGRPSELARMLLGARQVVRIGSVGHERAKGMLVHDRLQRGRVGHIERAHAAAARIPREERKGVGRDGERGASHRLVAARYGQVAPDGQHATVPGPSNDAADPHPQHPPARWPRSPWRRTAPARTPARAAS